MSIGHDRVRINAPSPSPLVDEIKQRTAELIDLMARGMDGQNVSGEAKRCAALAMTAYEEAAMWAVKAATTTKKADAS